MSVPPTVEGISAISLVTHAMARSVRFYRALGFTIRSGGEKSSFTSLHAGSGYLNLIARPADGQRSWWGRVIFYVTDVDAFYARAAAAKLEPDSTPADAEAQFMVPLPGAETPAERPGEG